MAIARCKKNLRHELINLKTLDTFISAVVDFLDLKNAKCAVVPSKTQMELHRSELYSCKKWEPKESWRHRSFNQVVPQVLLLWCQGLPKSCLLIVPGRRQVPVNVSVFYGMSCRHVQTSGLHLEVGTRGACSHNDSSDFQLGKCFKAAMESSLAEKNFNARWDLRPYSPRFAWGAAHTASFLVRSL